MAIDLDELERVAKAATPGPWHRSRYGTVFTGDHAMDDDAVVVGIVVGRGDPSFQDMRFIAEANPATVLALIERIRALEVMVGDARLELATSTSRT